jgi:hypothetical protein
VEAAVQQQHRDEHGRLVLLRQSRPSPDPPLYYRLAHSPPPPGGSSSLPKHRVLLRGVCRVCRVCRVRACVRALCVRLWQATTSRSPLRCFRSKRSRNLRAHSWRPRPSWTTSSAASSAACSPVRLPPFPLPPSNTLIQRRYATYDAHVARDTLTSLSR